MSNEHSAAEQEGLQTTGPKAFSSQEKALLNELLSTTFNSVTRIEEKSLKDPVTKATVSDIIKNIRDR